MKLKTIWIAVFLMILVFFIIQFNYFKVHNNTDSDDKVIYAMEIAGNIVTIAVFGLIPAGLISLIPFKQRTFRNKIKVAAPVCLLLVIIIMVGSTGYIAYMKEVKGIELGPVRK